MRWIKSARIRLLAAVCLLMAPLFGYAPHTAAEIAPVAPLDQSFPLSTSSTYVVSSADPSDPLFHKIETKLYPGPPGGIVANSLTWTGFLRQSGRTITVDLGQSQSITKVSIQFYQFTGDGILFPSSVHFAVSQNGKGWYDAGTVHTAVPLYQSGKLIQSYRVTMNPISARYVRVTFPVDVWVLARNLQVYGSPWLTPSLQRLPPLSNTTNQQGFLAPGSPTAEGIHNMLLVYSGAYGKEGTWTTKQFAPMVSYQSQTGQVQGRMFDSFLFLPYGVSLATSHGWSSYLQNLFAKGQQLSALNETVAQAYAPLKSIGYNAPTVNVVLSIPYPNDSVKNFGSIPGIQNMSFSSSNVGAQGAYLNRQAAVDWYVQELLAKWNEAHFTHLKLVGLYWDSESVQYTAPQEADLIYHASLLANKNHLQLFWIPTFDASGLVSWNELGFTAPIIQSNYFETPTLSVARVEEAAKEAFTYGMGMEVEMGPSVLTNETQRVRYYNQLVADYNTGVEDGAVHAFYDGSQVLTQAANSQNPGVRQLYIETYDFLIKQFSNSTYEPLP